MQMMNPGATVAELGRHARWVRLQHRGRSRQSQMMTGGAFGMIRPGGGKKTVQEWAECILRWLEGLRGGGDRGKPFNYGELMAQYFPGSNIDAWFEVQRRAAEHAGLLVDLRPRQDQGRRRRPRTRCRRSRLRPSPSPGSVCSDHLDDPEPVRPGRHDGRVPTPTGSSANSWFNDMLGSFINKMIPSCRVTGADELHAVHARHHRADADDGLERSGMSARLRRDGRIRRCRRWLSGGLMIMIPVSGSVGI